MSPIRSAALFSLCAFACALLVVPLLATAQSSSSSAAASSSISSESPATIDACKGEVEHELGYMHGQYRYVLFGQKPAAKESVNALRLDKFQVLWLKGNPNAWGASDGRVATDAEIDQTAVFKNRKGLLDVRGVLTSELVPSLTQSYRGFTCAVEAVCKHASLTPSETTALTREDGLVSITTPGCNPVLLPATAFQSCGEAGANDYASNIIAEQFCRPAALAMLTREAELLKMTVSYDAAYRSLLQFMGSLDGFAASFEGDLLRPLEQTVSIASQLSRIPCFLAQCNE